MKKVFVDLKIQIAVGLQGVAIMSLEEEINELYGMARSDITVPNLTLQDIECWGVEGWYESCVDDKPDGPGLYTFTGRASFDDDSSDYSLTCEQV